ncbi:MAG: rod shape-determining protein MreC [Minisyncoccia bacterium]
MRDSKKFLIIYLIIVLIFLSNFNKSIAKEYSNIYTDVLSLQKIAQKIFSSIKNILPFIKPDEYKKKYYDLLKEIAQIKIAEREKAFLESLNLIKSRYPNSTEVKILNQGAGGILYITSQNKIKEGSIVLDENWVLIGKVRKEIKDNVYEVITLNYPNLQFNVANLNGEIIGLAKTTGLGYIEVNYIEPQIKIKTGDLITTGGDDLFSRGFIIGDVIDLQKSEYFQKITISPIGNFDSDRFIVIQ